MKEIGEKFAIILSVMVTFWGKVNRGYGRGKQLGFPSANVKLHQAISEGIYLSYTKLKGQIYPSLTFIGAAKTFRERKYQSETHLLDFQGDLYDSWVSIKLLKKIRDNKRFKKVADLVKAMERDEVIARKYFSQEISSSARKKSLAL